MYLIDRRVVLSIISQEDNPIPDDFALLPDIPEVTAAIVKAMNDVYPQDRFDLAQQDYGYVSIKSPESAAHGMSDVHDQIMFVYILSNGARGFSQVAPPLPGDVNRIRATEIHDRLTGIAQS